MKLLILAEPKSAHIIKWVRALSEKGVSIFLFCLFPYSGNEYSGCKNLIIRSFNLNPQIFFKSENSLIKIIFVFALPQLRKIINQYKPDILHAHYATSYGTLAALAKFHPTIVSIWGSDIYDFPKKSWFHKNLLKYTLLKVDKILSTSWTMAEEIAKYTNKDISIVSFGIDLEKFKPDIYELKNKDIVIGTIKSLEDKYGITYLLEAFKIIQCRNQSIQMRLLIVGGGSKEKELKQLANKLKIAEKTVFTGEVKYDNVVSYYNQLDIAVFPSIFESFGVSVLEASACEKPVIVTNVGGFPEIVIDGTTGLIIEPKNAEQLAYAIEKLLHNNDLRHRIGKNARRHVEIHYNLKNNLCEMINIYTNLITKYR